MGNGVKMFEKFWRKSSLICRKIQSNQNLINNFHRAQKFKKATYKILRVWTKNEEKIQENFEIFYPKLWKIDFLHNFLLNIYWISASSPKVSTVGSIRWPGPGSSGDRHVGVPGGGAPRMPEKFSKMFIKTSMENNNFRPIFHNFNEFSLKNLSNFSRKYGKNLEVYIYRGFGGGATRSSRFY